MKGITTLQWALGGVLSVLTILVFSTSPASAGGLGGCNFGDECTERFVPYECENGEEGEFAGCDAGPKPGGGVQVICLFDCNGAGFEEVPLDEN